MMFTASVKKHGDKNASPEKRSSHFLDEALQTIRYPFALAMNNRRNHSGVIANSKELALESDHVIRAAQLAKEEVVGERDSNRREVLEGEPLAIDRQGNTRFLANGLGGWHPFQYRSVPRAPHRPRGNALEDVPDNRTEQ